MTHTRNFSFLLAPVLLVSVTFAQTKGSPVDSSPDQVVAAHNRYTQPAEISPDTVMAQNWLSFSDVDLVRSSHGVAIPEPATVRRGRSPVTVGMLQSGH